MPLYGGIEAGGTKFVCAVGSSPDDLRDEIRFPTTTPQESLGRAIAYFREKHAETPLHALGIAAFGPLEPTPGAPRYGYITTTPKRFWPDTNIVGIMEEALGLPVGFDTDVNGAALGEHVWGAAQELDTFVYLTVGTGLGGGGMVGGKLMHGLMHPEMGHMLVPHDRTRDPYAGNCIYHGDCLEGLVCGPALEARWGIPSRELAPDHRAWELEADYLAHGLVNIIYLLSPQRIIMGGGVMDQPHLLPMIRARVLELLQGYIQKDEITQRIDAYIVAPRLGNRAGVLGSIALAHRAAAATNNSQTKQGA